MHETVETTILASAVETYNLEISLGGVDVEALGKALSSALLAHERRVLERAAIILEALAEEMDSNDDCEEAIGLLGGAEKLREGIPPVAQEKESYLPQQDDIVEVVLAGRVHVAQETCDNCGHSTDALWSVYDFATGAEYFFDEAEVQGNLNIRVLHRSED